MRRCLDAIYDGCLALAGCFLVALFVVMVSEAFLRTFGSQLVGASEFVAWFCAAAGFLALPATFKRGDMVRVGALVDGLRPALRKPVLLFGLFVAGVFTAYMTWAVGKYLLTGWSYGDVTQGMIELPVWVPQLSFLIGVVILFISVVDEFITILRSPADDIHAERTQSVDDPSAE